jgi:TRAP-type C4-dicarboxylate transport system substrate-binding protein
MRRQGFRGWLTLLAWFAVSAASPASAEPVVVKLATLVPDGSSWHQILKETAEKWRVLSGGAVTLRIFTGGVSGDDPDVVRRMRSGTLNSGLLTAVGVAEIDKAVYALGVPMMYSSNDEAYWVLEKMRPRLEASLEAKGFVVLNWADGGFVYFFSQKPVATPDDLRRAKLFVPEGDRDIADVWKSGGFDPVPLPTTGIAGALQSGQVTALGVPPYVAAVSQFFQTARNMTDLPWQWLVGATVIRKDAWEKIAAELRPALLGAMREAGQRLRDDVRQSDARDVEAMRKRGLHVVPIDGPTRALWLKTAEALYPTIRGRVVPADAYDEATRWRDEYRKGQQPHPPSR